MTLSGEVEPGAGEPRHHCRQGNAENVGRLLVIMPFDIDQQEDTGKSFGQRCDQAMRFSGFHRIGVHSGCQFALFEGAPLGGGAQSVASGFIDPLMPSHRIEPAFQLAGAVPEMEFGYAALTDLLHEFIRIGQVTGQRNRKAAQLRKKADQITSDIDGCYRRGHGLSREALEVVTMTMSSRK